MSDPGNEVARSGFNFNIYPLVTLFATVTCVVQSKTTNHIVCRGQRREEVVAEYRFGISNKPSTVTKASYLITGLEPEETWDQ